MSWLGLDSESIVRRVRASGLPATVPSLGRMLVRGIAGATILSLAGFAPWALAGGWIQRRIGEGGLYTVCALTFIGLSGVLLQGLVIGPGSLVRLYGLFGAAFAAYSAAWISAWMGLRGHTGSLIGLLAGASVMGWILAAAFGERGAAAKSAGAIFVLNTLGYYAGGWVEGKAAHLSHLSFAGLATEKPPPGAIAMLLWGVCYGCGLGAGLGFAFHFCQKSVRERLSC